MAEPMNSAVGAMVPATKAVWSGIAVSSAAAGVVSWSLPFDFVGVPAPIVFMSFAGSAAGLVLYPPKIHRRWMFASAFAYTFFGAVVAVIAGKLPQFATLIDVLPAMGGLIALFGQSLVPAVRDTVPALRDRVRRTLGATDAPRNDDNGGR